MLVPVCYTICGFEVGLYHEISLFVIAIVIAILYLILLAESTNSLASLEDQLSIKYILTSRNRATVNYCNLSKVEAIMDKV